MVWGLEHHSYILNLFTSILWIIIDFSTIIQINIYQLLIVHLQITHNLSLLGMVLFKFTLLFVGDFYLGIYLLYAKKKKNVID